MRLTRSNRERLTDALLSLVLLNRCTSQEGVIGDRLKVAKLLFLATYELFGQQTRAFNFSFYRYHDGPFTAELYETWGELSWMGFLEVPPGPTAEISLTGDGNKAAKHYEQRLADLGNSVFLQVVKSISDTYAQLSTDELLKQVYGMEVTPLGWQRRIRISETQMGTYLTCVLDANEAVKTVVIDDAVANDFLNELPDWAAEAGDDKAPSSTGPDDREDALPTPDDVRGIIPNFTGGKPAEQYLKERWRGQQST